MASKKRIVAVIDFETDPFSYGRVPKPFCVEFYSDEQTAQFWGDDCAEQLCAFLDKLPEPHLIYAHNGGKFDFHFLHEYIDNPALIIKSRIVECKLFKHTLRDSYAIIPVPLRDYEKQEFDYAKMERNVREKYKAQILEYLHSDCVYLFELVSHFNERFGPRITIGGTAIRELRKVHPWNKCGSGHDKTFRPYYFGGRVECFQSGVIGGGVKLYDVNSMYPYVMKTWRHPINGRFELSRALPSTFERPYFAHIVARNRGALPSKNENGSLTFNKASGEFFACSHEIEAALEFDLIDIIEVKRVMVATEFVSFDKFIDEQYRLRREAKDAGDRIGDLFAKLLMNSSYGRFGINPENFEDWNICRSIDEEMQLREQGFRNTAEFPHFNLWSKPAEIMEEQYADVSTAASITSASRAHLLRGLQKSVDPIYCDTDSIICRGFSGDVDSARLGAWDLEKTAEYVAIAGKKLYTLYDDPDGKPVKLSSKGGNLTKAELIKIALGGEVRYDNPAPTFSLRKAPSFVSRNFKKTA
jgi:hypothetical protein